MDSGARVKGAYMSALKEIGQLARCEFPVMSHNALGLSLPRVGLSCDRLKHLVLYSKNLPGSAP